MSEFRAKRLVTDKFVIEGKLLLYQDRVVFEPYEEEAVRLETPLTKIRDVRFATTADVEAIKAWIQAPELMLFERKRKVLLMDVEDENGMVEHLAFEGDEMDAAADEIDYMVRMEKTGKPKAVEPIVKKELEHGNWQCSKCSRINSAKARFCTKCGEAKNRSISSNYDNKRAHG